MQIYLSIAPNLEFYCSDKIALHIINALLGICPTEIELVEYLCTRHLTKY